MTMPDTRVSMFAAPMSEVIARLATTSLPDEGVLVLGRLDDLDVTWQKCIVKPTIVVPVEGSTMRVRLGARAHAAIETEVRRYRRVERAVYSWAGIVNPHNRFTSLTFFSAPPDSTRHATLFVLGTKGLTRAIDGFASPTEAMPCTVWELGTPTSPRRAPLIPTGRLQRFWAKAGQSPSLC